MAVKKVALEIVNVNDMILTALSYVGVEETVYL